MTTNFDRVKHLVEQAEDGTVIVMTLQGSKFVDIYIPGKIGRLLPVVELADLKAAYPQKFKETK